MTFWGGTAGFISNAGYPVLSYRSWSYPHIFTHILENILKDVLVVAIHRSPRLDRSRCEVSDGPMLFYIS